MKLYTRPRPLQVWQLRPGDQIAISKRRAGLIINNEGAYMDADLDDRVTWAAIHAVFEVEGDEPTAGERRIQHTLGENDRPAGSTVIMREVIELDPWTYLRSRE